MTACYSAPATVGRRVTILPNPRVGDLIVRDGQTGTVGAVRDEKLTITWQSSNHTGTYSVSDLVPLDVGVDCTALWQLEFGKCRARRR